jgi:hypothetical protein
MIGSSLDGGGDRVRLSRDLERDVISTSSPGSTPTRADQRSANPIGGGAFMRLMTLGRAILLFGSLAPHDHVAAGEIASTVVRAPIRALAHLHPDELRRVGPAGSLVHQQLVHRHILRQEWHAALIDSGLGPARAVERG